MNTPLQHHIRHFRRAFGRKPGALPHQSENCMDSRSAHGGGSAAGGMVLLSKKLECVVRSACALSLQFSESHALVFVHSLAQVHRQLHGDWQPAVCSRQALHVKGLASHHLCARRQPGKRLDQRRPGAWLPPTRPVLELPRKLCTPTFCRALQALWAQACTSRPRWT